MQAAKDPMQGGDWPQIPQCLSDDSDMLPLIITSLCKWMPGATRPVLDKDFRLVYRRYLELILLTITMKRALARGEFGGMLQPETGDRNSSVPSELVLVRSTTQACLCLAISSTSMVACLIVTSSSTEPVELPLLNTLRGVQQLWKNTVAALPVGQDLEEETAYSYKFFADLCAQGAIHPADLEPLIAPDSPHQPPHCMTSTSLQNLFAIILMVNKELGLIQSSPQGLLPDALKHEVASGGKRLVGFDYLYDVLVMSNALPVANDAADMLVQVYVQPYSGYGRCYASWKTCASSCLLTAWPLGLRDRFDGYPPCPLVARVRFPRHPAALCRMVLHCYCGC
jgi:hypothetical protein